MSYPPFLYKAFSQVIHAEDLMRDGILRMSCLDVFKNIECAHRRDHTEGDGFYVDGAGISELFHNGNTVYIYCCASPFAKTQLLSNQFGEHIVKIKDVGRLKILINEYFQSNNIKLHGDVECSEVVYNKGLVSQIQLSSTDRYKLAMLQKPPAFSDELEFRYTALVQENGMPSERILNINLNQPLTFIDLIERKHSN